MHHNDRTLTFYWLIIRVVGNLMNLWKKQLPGSRLKRLGFLAMLRLVSIGEIADYHCSFCFVTIPIGCSHDLLLEFNMVMMHMAGWTRQMGLFKQKTWHILWRVYVPIARDRTTWSLAREECPGKNLGMSAGLCIFFVADN